MPKLRIVEDSWYPCYAAYDVQPGESDQPWHDIVEVDKKTAARWERAMKAFGKVQSEMANAVREQPAAKEYVAVSGDVPSIFEDIEYDPETGKLI